MFSQNKNKPPIVKEDKGVILYLYTVLHEKQPDIQFGFRQGEIMSDPQEDALLMAFRQLEPKFKEIVLRSVKAQAIKCAARRPKLKLAFSATGIGVSASTRAKSF